VASAPLALLHGIGIVAKYVEPLSMAHWSSRGFNNFTESDIGVDLFELAARDQTTPTYWIACPLTFQLPARRRAKSTNSSNNLFTTRCEDGIHRLNE
jgi:hypothetical protein